MNTPSSSSVCGVTRLQGLGPIANAQTRVLVLGSFPGAASLAAGQYYAHPRNQLWPIMASLWPDDPLPIAYTQRCAWLLAHGIGLWDVYASCVRQGSLDSAIREASCNDFAGLQQHCPQLALIAHNGQASYRHHKLLLHLGLPCVRLPSTSPAHASMRLAQKTSVWQAAIRPYLRPVIDSPAATSAQQAPSQ